MILKYESYEFLLFERRPNGVLVVTINRPEKLNAANDRMLDDVLVTVGGTIYAMGGFQTAGSVIVSTVEAYDPATNSWTTKTSMPSVRDSFSAVQVGGRIFEGADAWLDGKLIENGYPDLIKKQKTGVTGVNGWIGLSQKYWFAGLVPDQKGAQVHHVGETPARFTKTP